MAHCGAAAAAHAGHRQLPLYKILRQFAEEPPVAPVVNRAPGIEPSRHAREAAERAGIPGPDAFHLVWCDLSVSHGETRASRTHMGAAAAFEASAPDLLPR